MVNKKVFGSLPSPNTVSLLPHAACQAISCWTQLESGSKTCSSAEAKGLLFWRLRIEFIHLRAKQWRIWMTCGEIARLHPSIRFNYWLFKSDRYMMYMGLSWPYIYIYTGQPTNYSIFWSHFLLKESRLTYMMTDTIQATNSFPHSILQHPRNRGFTHIWDTQWGCNYSVCVCLNIPKDES